MIGWILIGLVTALLKNQTTRSADETGDAMIPSRQPVEFVPSASDVWGSPQASRFGQMAKTSADVLPGDDASRDPQDPYTGYTSWSSSRVPTGGFARQDTESLLNPNVTNRVVSMPSEPRANLDVRGPDRSVSGLRGRRL